MICDKNWKKGQGLPRDKLDVRKTLKKQIIVYFLIKGNEIII